MKRIRTIIILTILFLSSFSLATPTKKASDLSDKINCDLCEVESLLKKGDAQGAAQLVLKLKQNFSQYKENHEKIENEMNMLSVRHQRLTEKYNELEDLSYYDSKIRTGDALEGGIPFVFNTRLYKEWLPKNLSKFRPRTISAIYMDLDDLKALNNTYDNEGADVVIDRFALIVDKVLGHYVRTTDKVFFGRKLGEYPLENSKDRPVYLGRHGGDEFYILMLDTPYRRVLEVADMIRSSVASNTAVFDGLTKKTKEEVQRVDIKAKHYDKPNVSVTLGVYQAPILNDLYSTEENSKLINGVISAANSLLVRGKFDKKRNTVHAVGACQMFFSH